MSKKAKFTIGDWVEFRKYVQFGYADNVRTVFPYELPALRIGRVVGLRLRRIGTYDPGYKVNRFNFDDGGEPPYLEVKGTQPAWLVATSLMGKPFEVLEEDLAHNQVRAWNAALPMLEMPQAPISEDVREERRKQANAQLRVNGKFAKMSSEDNPTGR